MIELKVKLKSSVPGIIEEIADCGDVDTDTLQEPPDIRPEKRSEGKLLNIDKERSMEMP